MSRITFIDLGLTDFEKVWRFQKDLVSHRKYYQGNDVLLFCEHRPVITLGRRSKRENILYDTNEIREKGIDLVKIDRGGDVTFHGPGQLVAYPIFDLKKRSKDILFFMKGLEKVVIKTLLSYGISSYAKEDIRGVWVGGKKICSLGVGVSGWISYHGLALNINNDLNSFKYIKPCGLDAQIITSISSVLAQRIDMAEAKKILLKEFHNHFSLENL